jgi:ABC-2 type transport system permease protein
MKTLYWLVKREIWEHKGGFIWAPVIGAIVFLVLNFMGLVAAEVTGARHGFQFGSVSFQEMARNLDEKSLAMVGSGLDAVMLSSTAILATIMGFVVFFYCLGSLYDDRRDRSLLFWKSLPISDTQTVISKVIAATIVAPAAAFVTGVLTGIVMLLMFAIALSMHGISIWDLLVLAHPFRVIGNLLASIPMYCLWALPTVGWLLLCSAWAKSKPFLWAVTVPVVFGVVLWWFSVMGVIGGVSFYWKTFLPRLLGSVLPGSWLGSASLSLHMDDDNKADAIVRFLDVDVVYSALATPTAWIGIIAGVLLIGGAIWLRRWREDA